MILNNSFFMIDGFGSIFAETLLTASREKIIFSQSCRTLIPFPEKAEYSRISTSQISSYGILARSSAEQLI